MPGEAVGLAAAFGDGVAFELAAGAGVGVGVATEAIVVFGGGTEAMMVFGGGLTAPSLDPDLSDAFGRAVFVAAFRAAGNGLLTGLAGVLTEFAAGFVRAASRLPVFDPAAGARALARRSATSLRSVSSIVLPFRRLTLTNSDRLCRKRAACLLFVTALA